MIDYRDLLKLPEFHLLIEKMRYTNHHYRPPNYIDRYHLEGDVWSHTAMVVDYVMNRLKSDKNDLYIASIFHDVGKIYNHKIDDKERKFQFVNHWFYSGNIFKEFFIENSLVDRKKDIPYMFDLYRIIQLHHIDRIPHYIRDNLNREISFQNFNLLKKLCEANENGRITDRGISLSRHGKLFDKYRDLTEEDFNNGYTNIHFSNSDRIVEDIISFLEERNINKVLILPVAPPASGKSTVAKKITERLGNRFYRVGYDDIRLEVYCERLMRGKKKYTVETADTELYHRAHRFVDEEKIDIHSILIERVNKKIKEGTVVFVDNTNATYRSRRRILSSVEEKVLKICIFFFNISLREIFSRNRERNIKIKESVIRHIYNTISFPSLSEFDEIFVV